MSKRLENKRALLTAAGQGIGRATAIAMVREGAHVFATDINGESLADLQREAEGLGTIETFTLDVTDNDAVVAGVARAQPDILFNCAGFVHNGTILECTDEEWSLAWDLNVGSMHRTIRAALPGMVERGTGSILSLIHI